MCSLIGLKADGLILMLMGIYVKTMGRIFRSVPACSNPSRLNKKFSTRENFLFNAETVGFEPTRLFRVKV